MALKRTRDHDDFPPPPGDPPDETIRVTAENGDLNRHLFAEPEMHDLRIDVRWPNPNLDAMVLSTYFCNSSLLAASSPVLFKRMHGPMREKGLLDRPRMERVLRIDGDANHVYFNLLLQYIEGRPVSFDSDTTPMVYMLAEFYEVYGLSAACSQYWFDALEPSNCCTLMGIAKAVNCSVLEEQCYDLLVLGFMKVVARDPAFGFLDFESLHRVAKMDSLVVKHELALFLALLRWFGDAGGDGDCDLLKREEQLVTMLRECVRWDRLLNEEADPPKCLAAYNLECPYERRKAFVLSVIGGFVYEAYDCKGVTKRTCCEPEEQARRDVRNKLRTQAYNAKRRLQIFVRDECLANVRFLWRDPVTGEFPSLQLPTPFRLNTNPRNYAWGSLHARNAAAPNVQTYADTGHHFFLSGDKPHLVGRSRSADIRIPTITASARHFSVYNKVVWGHPDPNSGYLADAYGLDCKAERENSTARLVPYITGMSQTAGTYLQTERMTPNDSQPLPWGAMIQLVSPTVVEGYPIPPHFYWKKPEFVLEHDEEKDPWHQHVMQAYTTEEEDKRCRSIEAQLSDGSGSGV